MFLLWLTCLYRVDHTLLQTHSVHLSLFYVLAISRKVIRVSSELTPMTHYESEKQRSLRAAWLTCFPAVTSSISHHHSYVPWSWQDRSLGVLPSGRGSFSTLLQLLATIDSKTVSKMLLILEMWRKAAKLYLMFTSKTCF
jgi:hypothetical protein